MGSKTNIQYTGTSIAFLLETTHLYAANVKTKGRKEGARQRTEGEKRQLGSLCGTANRKGWQRSPDRASAEGKLKNTRSRYENAAENKSEGESAVDRVLLEST